MAIYFRELCLVAPSQVSRHAAVGTATGMDRSWAWYRLRDRGFSQQTSPTPAGAPSEEDSLLRATKPKSVVYTCSPLSVVFVVGFLGLHKTTKKSSAEPRYMSFEAQTFLLNRVHDYALLRLEDVVIGTAAVSHLILLIPKLWFEATTPVFTPFLYRSTDHHIFLCCRGVGMFWTVLGQSGAELPIFICPQ